MLDLNRLRHVVAVARAGSYGGAATAIHISQSALSRSVQALEAEYAVQLFDRGRAGARLTLEGAGFVRIAEDVLRRADSAHAQLRGIRSNEAQPVHFGMGAISAVALLPDLLPVLVEDGTRFRVRVESNVAMQLLLRHGEIDFFLGGLQKGAGMHVAANDFVVELMPAASVGLLVRQDHPLLGRPPTVAALSAYPTAAGSFVRDTLAPAVLERIGLRPPSVESDDYWLLANLVRRTNHILIAGSILAPSLRDFGIVPLSLETPIENQADWGLVRSGRAELSPPSLRAARLIGEAMVRLVAATDEVGRGRGAATVLGK